MTKIITTIAIKIFLFSTLSVFLVMNTAQADCIPELYHLLYGKHSLSKIFSPFAYRKTQKIYQLVLDIEERIDNEDLNQLTQDLKDEGIRITREEVAQKVLELNKSSKLCHDNNMPNKQWGVMYIQDVKQEMLK